MATEEAAELPLDGEQARVAARMSGLLLSRESVDSVLELIVSLAGTTIAAAAGGGGGLGGGGGGGGPRRGGGGGDPGRRRRRRWPRHDERVGSPGPESRHPAVRVRRGPLHGRPGR